MKRNSVLLIMVLLDPVGGTKRPNAGLGVARFLGGGILNFEFSNCEIKFCSCLICEWILDEGPGDIVCN